MYTVWTLAGDLTNYAVLNHYGSSTYTYFDFYFVTKIIDSALQFCVLVELAWSVFRPFRASLPKNTVWFLGALTALAGAAIWPFAKDPAFVHFPTQWQMLGRFMQTDSILRVLFFVILAGCSQLLSIGWRDRELQIATGLGFYSLVALAISAVHAQIGAAHGQLPQHYHLLDQFLVASYVPSLTYWAFSFAQKEAKSARIQSANAGNVAGSCRGGAEFKDRNHRFVIWQVTDRQGLMSEIDQNARRGYFGSLSFRLGRMPQKDHVAAFFLWF